MPTSAELLLGLKLSNGWTVVERVIRKSTATGGAFSESYIVEGKDGRRAFLKALDFSSALSAPDPARALQILTEAFNFERDLLASCREHKLNRIVTAIDDGTAKAPDGGTVQYLIFELADGDVRVQADAANRFDMAFSIRALHGTAAGLSQLHSRKIAHQDLKPSNILVFDDGDLTKLGDLGRAALSGATPPHDNQSIQGDPTYAPIELAYNHIDPDWNRRRLGCDLYHLGSMIAFFFVGQGITSLLGTKLPTAFWPGNWHGTYSEVLPHVRAAFDEVINMVSPHIPLEFRGEICTMIRQLCEPDPSLRGHPSNRGPNAQQHGLERYISRLNALAKQAEYYMIAQRKKA